MLNVKKNPFKAVENYFTDFLFYQDPLKPAEDKTPEDYDSDNKADTELEPEEECLWEINPLVMSVDKLACDVTANIEGEWFINENLDFAYFPTFAFNFVLSYTSTKIVTLSRQWMS